MGLFSALRDRVYENYRAAFVVGTGVLALASYLADPKRRAGRALGGWAAVLAAGAVLDPCVDPQSQSCGPVLARGATEEPVVALTFDDGPSVPATGQILDVLQREGVPAAFFCLGRQVRRHPDLVERMVREGHLVGNHTDTHPNLLFCSPGRARREIEAGTRVVAEVLGEPPRWFRPPYGFRYPWTLLHARSLGQSTALWSNCPRDWQRPGVEVLVRRVVESARPGDVVLLHDGGGDRSQTVQALPLLIRELRARGFRLVRLDRVDGTLPLQRSQRPRAG